MTIRIVPMDRSHIEALAELERLSFSSPWSIAMLQEELFNDTASYLVAEDETGKVLGYAGLHVILDEGYIDNVVVHPDYRRKGIARKLVEVYLRFGAAKLSFLTLEVRESNVAALELYRSLGFAPEGRRPQYYRNPKEDAILMTRRWNRDSEEA